MSETKRLADYTVHLSFADLSADVVEMAKLSLLDWLGCCIRGFYEKPALIAQEVLKPQAPEGKATVFSQNPWRTSALFASLLNGLASHALDMDDVHTASQTHLGVAVIPAALAAAQELPAVSGKELITAIVAGYEIMGRVGRSVMPDSYYYWHTTGTAGAFGSAAAAGKLLALNADEMVFCLGSAGTQAAGLFEFLKDGTNSKTLHAGKAAFNGLLSAQLAKKGFTAAYKILEGEKGFLNAMSQKPQPNLLTEGLGQGFIISENSFKPYACCRWTHPAIGAALAIRARNNPDLTAIKKITIKTDDTGLDVTDNANPQTIYGCKFSIQYCVAAALLFGRLGINEFSEENIKNPDILRLIGLCATIAIDREAAGRGEVDGRTVVRIEMTDGSVLEEKVLLPLGDSQNPMKFSDIEDKFRSLTESVCTNQQIADILRFVWELEQLQSVSEAFNF
ncbi:MAG: MmgE/PrpD family protein [Firmicutes bacterium]|nr:MmgE/PrpD family protein [Bacillota bacterium]